MAAKRTPARKPTPARESAVSPVLSPETTARLDTLVEDFLYGIGLFPQAVFGLTHEQLRAKWNLTLGINEPTGSKLHEFIPLPPQDIQGRLHQFVSLPDNEYEQLGLLLNKKLDQWRHVPQPEPKSTVRDFASSDISDLSGTDIKYLDLSRSDRWKLAHGQSISISVPGSASVELPKAQDDERRRMLDYEKSFIQDGVRYFPLSAAAPVIQAPAPSLLHWIKKQTKFEGRPLQSYYFAPANQYFISEESIDRAASRFIKWPSQEPAGPVTLGEKRDQSGYIGLTDAAQTIGVDHHTMWRWATKKTAPTGEPLDVIKCPASDQLYIRQKDITALKKLVPRSGLRAGRRPQTGLQHG